jgi:hypothetical protein
MDRSRICGNGEFAAATAAANATVFGELVDILLYTHVCACGNGKCQSGGQNTIKKKERRGSNSNRSSRSHDRRL